MKHAMACICFLLAASLHAQEPLTNETVIKLAKAGIGEDIILGMVNQQPGNYELSADNMIALKKAGVSDKVLSAMVVKNSGSNSQVTPNTAARLKNTGETAAASETPAEAGPNSLSSPYNTRTRVFVTDSLSWASHGGWSAAGTGNPDTIFQPASVRAQTAEVIKNFNQRCPQLVVTNSVQKADYAITFDHEGSKVSIGRRNKIVVFNRTGDDIFSDSTRELGNSVKNACEAILSHRPFHLPSSTASSSASNIFSSPSVFDVTFTSVPANAVVTITGQPIGRTPFTTKLPPGIYKAVFSAAGYAALSKDVTIGEGYPTTVTTTLRTQ